MNLLGHLCCSAPAPREFRLGSVLPDLVALYRRRVRPRVLVRVWRKHPQPPPGTGAVLDGMDFHHEVDAHFHRHPVFTETAQAISTALREASDAPGLKRFLPAHVLAELLLDHLLLRSDPGLSEAFYEELASGSRLLTEIVSAHPEAGRTSFADFLERIQTDRFVEDYRTHAGIFYRMNRILTWCGQRAMEGAEEEAVARVFQRREHPLAVELPAFVRQMQELMETEPMEAEPMEAERVGTEQRGAARSSPRNAPTHPYPQTARPATMSSSGLDSPAGSKRDAALVRP